MVAGRNAVFILVLLCFIYSVSWYRKERKEKRRTRSRNLLKGLLSTAIKTLPASVGFLS